MFCTCYIHPQLGLQLTPTQGFVLTVALFVFDITHRFCYILDDV